MGEYLFRFPKDTGTLDFDGLASRDVVGSFRIGSTVTVTHWVDYGTMGDFYKVRLYGTTIANVARNSVHFPQHGDRHQATREWIKAIVLDNKLGTTIYRNRKGVLVIDGDSKKPVEGHSYDKPLVIDGQTWEQFAANLFEYELCGECGQGADGHEPWVVLGHWFAHCKTEPAIV